MLSDPQKSLGRSPERLRSCAIRKGRGAPEDGEHGPCAGSGAAIAPGCRRRSSAKTRGFLAAEYRQMRSITSSGEAVRQASQV